MTIATIGRTAWRDADPQSDPELAVADGRVGTGVASAVLLCAGLAAALETALAAVASL